MSDLLTIEGAIGAARSVGAAVASVVTSPSFIGAAVVATVVPAAAGSLLVYDASGDESNVNFYRKRRFMAKVIYSLRKWFADEQQWWENPLLLEENKIPTHVNLRYYDTLKEADEACRDWWARLDVASGRRFPVSRWVFKLDCEDGGEGKSNWRFAFAEGTTRNAEVASKFRGFEELGFDDSSWAAVKVPTAWQNLGYGRRIYTNQVYPWLGTSWGVLLGNQLAGCFEPEAIRIPDWINETGFYRRAFRIPSHMRDELARGTRRMRLVFRAAGPALKVWVDGIYVGLSKGSMTEAEFDVTDALSAGRSKSGAHVLAVQIVRYGDAAYLEDQDQWWTSGIHRSVELHCVPNVRIEDYRLSAVPSPRGEAGIVRVHLDLGGSGLSEEDATVRMSMRGPKGEVVRFTKGWISSQVESPSIRIEDRDLGPVVKIELSKSVRNGNDSPQMCIVELHTGSEVQTWDPQSPNLYTLCLELSVDGNAVQAEVARVGFRSVTVTADGQLMVNGTPIRICGVNRHEHDENHCKTLTEDSMAMDIIQMKRHNFNAVRCSHYPNYRRLYELCDEMGMFVCDEANIETHGFSLTWSMSLLANTPGWEGAFVSRVQAMARRTHNHPSVIMWSLGNESGAGPAFQKAHAWLAAFDQMQNRPIQYESASLSRSPKDPKKAMLIAPRVLGDGRADTTISDVICPMYAQPKTLIEITERGAFDDESGGVTVAGAAGATATKSGAKTLKQKRPLILCEYTHAMGNSNGNAHVYADLFLSRSGERKGSVPDTYADLYRLQGGFVWDWKDQGIAMETIKGVGAGPLTSKGLREEVNNADIDTEFACASQWGYGTDFGPIGKEFGNGDIDLNFCINGLVWPDGTPHPAMKEFKYIQQPVAFVVQRQDISMADTSYGKEAVEASLKVRGRVLDAFWKNARDDLEFRWTLHYVGDGIGVQAGESCVLRSGLCSRSPVGSPGKSGIRRGDRRDFLLEVKCGAVESAFFKRNRCYVRVSAHLVRDTCYAPTGFEVAYGNFLVDLPYDAAKSSLASLKERRAAALKPCRVEGTADFAKGDLIVSGKTYKATLQGGRLVSLVALATSRELFVSPLRHSFYRAPTDNDKGGGDAMLSMLAGEKTYMARVLAGFIKSMPGGDQMSYSWWWRQLDLRSLESSVTAVTGDELDLKVTEEHRTPAQSGGGSTKTVFVTVTSYRFAATGVTVTVKVAPGPFLEEFSPPTLPRVGLALGLASELENVTYAGHGPHENYCDRKASAWFAVHKSTVKKMHTPYITPSECGGRTGVEWVRLDTKVEKGAEENASSSALHIRYKLLDEVAPEELRLSREADGDEGDALDHYLFPAGAKAASVGDYESSAVTTSRPRGSGRGAQISISPYDEFELDDSKHQFELEKEKLSGKVVVHIDTAHCGVGGDCSWAPQTHKQYWIGTGKEWKYEVVLTVQ